MAIGPGSRLGPYEITALIGEGGMGKVWRAHHTALKRDDALKVLPDAFASDTDRLARFRREAQVLASLNHPNIAHVYGLEQSDGVQALVMELVEGPTLADRIAQGPIPVDEALPIAKQIAEALEAAHEQGIIHRDLKPANIKLRPDGTVKVLDFGLAKALEPVAAVGMDATASPTITSPAMMTGVGMLLGTAAYMSPEQARGKAVDKRSDIWAFGCVLYEMLTGQRAFAGEDVTETLAAVVKSEPAWEALPESASPSIRTFLRRCLRKNLKQRLQDIGDMRLVLEGAFDGLMELPHTSVAASAGTTWRYVRVSVAALMVGGALVGFLTWYVMRATPAATVRTYIPVQSPAGLLLSNVSRDLAITPDGSRVVYRGQEQLFVRALDALEAEPLVRGIGDVRHVFVSPDSQWVGFFNGPNVIRKVPVSGGSPITVTASVDGTNSRGASWGPDNSIVFATLAPETGLQRVEAAGGMPTVLTKPDPEQGERDHYWPEFLPNGNAVLFTIWPANGRSADAQIAVFDLRTNTRKVLVRGGSHAYYVEPGYVVYGAAGSLHAVRFDSSDLAVVGTPVPVLEQVTTTEEGALELTVATNGTVVYFPGGAGVGEQRILAWVDRGGNEEILTAPPRAYVYPRISPDGTRVALDVRDQENDIWIWDFERQTLTRLTFEPGGDEYPVWTPDGRRLVFGSGPPNVQNIFVQAADGTGKPERLTQSLNDQDPQTITPDGKTLIFREFRRTARGADLMTLSLMPPNDSTPLRETPFAEQNAEVSPDGRWVAYQSNESGRYEVYVRPFPQIDKGRWQLSADGGVMPAWARKGNELFFRGPDGSIMSVQFNGSSTVWRNTTPIKLLSVQYALSNTPSGRNFDVAPDGRFLIIKDFENHAAANGLVVIQHWQEELKRRVPVN